MNQISIDDPGNIDRLGRVAFARHLLDLAVRVDATSTGAVLGLEGKWGSGKTRVIRSLEAVLEEIEEEARPVLISFNPWMVSGTPGLVAALLLHMAAEISPKVEGNIFQRAIQKISGNEKAFKELSASLVAYASVLSVVKNFSGVADLLHPGSGAILKRIGQVAETAGGVLGRAKRDTNQLSLSQSKNQVESLLRKIKRRVIVVIDDLDRLPPVEIAAMIQAVKAVADFPNLVYVLAYDPEVAVAAINSAMEIETGQQFLEKIIQMPVPLPEIPAGKMNIFAAKRLNTALDARLFIEQPAEDVAKAIKLAAAAMVTPRDVERLRTRLLVATGVIKNEINLADLILLETLALRSPAIVAWIEANVTAVIQNGINQYDEDLAARGQFGDRVFDYSLDSAKRKVQERERALDWQKLIKSSREKVALSNIMKFLFESCRGDWEKRDFNRVKFRRVQEYRYWYRWRCYHDHHELWTIADIQDLLRYPLRIVERGLISDASMFKELCQQICDIGVEGFSSVDLPTLMDVFIRVEGELGLDVVLEHDLGYGPNKAITVGLRLADMPVRVSSLRNLIEQASVWYSGSVLVGVVLESNGNSSGRYSQAHSLKLDRSEIEFLAKAWFQKVDHSFTLEAWPSGMPGYTPYTLMSWMFAMGREPNRIRELAAQFIDGKAEGLEVMLSGFANTRIQGTPMNLNWLLLPRLDRVFDLASTSARFMTSHSQFMEELLPIAIEQKKEHQKSIKYLADTLKMIKK